MASIKITPQRGGKCLWELVPSKLIFLPGAGEKQGLEEISNTWQGAGMWCLEGEQQILPMVPGSL